jgi:hypothetical protein
MEQQIDTTRPVCVTLSLSRPIGSGYGQTTDRSHFEGSFAEAVAIVEKLPFNQRTSAYFANESGPRRKYDEVMAQLRGGTDHAPQPPKV